jgi:rhodanese-related sulfurtransferase
MRFKKWIGIVATILVVFETMTFAYQQIAPSQAESKIKKERTVQVEFMTPEELKTKITKNETPAILDLRSEASYSQNDKTIKGSLHSKVRKVVTRMRGVPRDREVITYCACPADEAAILAARALQAAGFTRVRVLKGGWSAWLQAGGQLEPRRL